MENIWTDVDGGALNVKESRGAVRNVTFANITGGIGGVING